MNKLNTGGLLLLALILFADRFVISIPDWLAVIMILIAITLFFLGMVQERKKRLS